MPLSLHAVSVGTYNQILPSLTKMIDKAEEHCRSQGLPTEALSSACLAEGMWPFAKQVMASIQHSAGAIRGLRAGVVNGDFSAPPLEFAVLRTHVQEAIAMLQEVDPAEIDGMVGRDMRFEFGSHRMDFTAEDYILTFALPNFYFHTTAAYAILRNQGVALGKMDFLGRPRLKG